MLSPPIVIIFSNNMINGSDWFVRDGPPVKTLLYFSHPKTIKYWSQHRSMLESLYHCGCIIEILKVGLSHLAGGCKLIVQIMRRHLLHGSLSGL